MSTRSIAKTIDSMYSKLYLLFYRRKNPREYRPRPEALAVMEHLTASGPLTVFEAATHLDRSFSAISELIDRLVKRGLLERIPDDRDRRRKLVWLSSKGRDLLAEERHILDTSRLEDALENMTDEQRRHLVEGLHALADAATRLSRRDGSKQRGKKHE